MADRENFNDRSNWESGKNRRRDVQSDPRLDDRSGASPGSAGGYRAREDYDDYYDDGRPSRGREERSFGPRHSERDYGFAEQFEGGAEESSWRSEPMEWSARRHGGQRHYSGAGYGGGRPRAADMRDNDYRAAMRRGRYGGSDYQSYPFNPYEASWGVGPDFGFGRDVSGHPDSGRRSSGRPDDDRGFWDRAGDELASWFGDDEAAARRDTDKRESHAGRGPKGYRRADNRIEEDVCEHLTRDPWLNASHIEVEVKDREVTLNGKVANRDDKRRAERCAEQVSGVEHVQNNLRVDRNLQSDPTVESAGVEPVGEYSTIAKQARGSA